MTAEIKPKIEWYLCLFVLISVWLILVDADHILVNLYQSSLIIMSLLTLAFRKNNGLKLKLIGYTKSFNLFENGNVFHRKHLFSESQLNN